LLQVERAHMGKRKNWKLPISWISSSQGELDFLLLFSSFHNLRRLWWRRELWNIPHSLLLDSKKTSLGTLLAIVLVLGHLQTSLIRLPLDSSEREAFTIKC
jgi:hypothetical protein